MSPWSGHFVHLVTMLFMLTMLGRNLLEKANTAMREGQNKASSGRAWLLDRRLERWVMGSPVARDFFAKQPGLRVLEKMFGPGGRED